MDLLITTGIFIALILAPILWRARQTNKRRIVEKVVFVLFLAWLLFAIKTFL